MGELKPRALKLAEQLTVFGPDLRLAYAYTSVDPPSSLTKSRIVMEKLLREIYLQEMGHEPRKPLLGDMLADTQFTRKIERRILSRMHAIRDMGNLGPHGEAVEPSDAVRVLDDLCTILDWYLERWARTKSEEPSAAPPVPTPADASSSRRWQTKHFIVLTGALMAVAVVATLLGQRLGGWWQPNGVDQPKLVQADDAGKPKNVPPPGPPPEPEMEPAYSIRRVSRSIDEANWVGFRGGPDLNTCIGSGPNPPLKQAWRIKARMSHPPACAAGRLFVPDRDRVVAIDCANGEVAWTSAKLELITTYPVTFDDKLYIGCGQKLFVLSCKTGKVLTERATQGNGLGLLVSGKHLYIVTDDNIVAKMTLDDLQTAWRTKIGEFLSRRQIAVLFTDDASDLVFSYTTQLSALDKQTGNVIWKSAPQASNERQSVPVIYQGLIFADLKYEHLGVLDARTGAELGRFRIIGPYAPWRATWALRDGVLFWGNYGGSVIALDLVTKQILWTKRDAAGASGFHQTPVVDSLYVYFVNSEDTLTVLNRETGAREFTLHLPNYGGNLSSPIVYREKLIIPSDGEIVCLESEKK